MKTKKVFEKKEAGNNRKSFFRLTVTVMSIAILLGSIATNSLNTINVNAEDNYDIRSINNNIKSLVNGKNFLLINDLSDNLKIDLKKYFQYLVDKSCFDGTALLMDENYNSYILNIDGHLYSPFWIYKNGGYIEAYTDLNGEQELIYDKDTFVYLGKLEQLARNMYVGKKWIDNNGANHHNSLCRKYNEDAEWAAELANSERNWGYGFTAAQFAQTAVTIWASAGLGASSAGFGGLKMLKLFKLTEDLSLLSSIIKVVEIADLAVLTYDTIAVSTGELNYEAKWRTESLKYFSDIKSQKYGVNFGKHVSKFYLAYLIFRDLQAAFGDEWISDCLVPNIDTPGFLTEKVIEAHNKLHTSNFVSGLIVSCLGLFSVNNADQARTCYMDSIDANYIRYIDLKLANDLLPKIKHGTISSKELFRYYEFLLLRSNIVAGLYERVANQAENELWGQVFGIKYPKIVTQSVNIIMDFLTGNSIEDAIENFRCLRDKECKYAVEISALLYPNVQLEMYETYYEEIVCKGKMDVNPKTWSEVIYEGCTSSKSFSITARENDVKGVEIYKVKGPRWMHLDYSYFGIVSTDKSRSFTVTVSPPEGTTSTNYPFDIRITCTSGTPSEIHITGTISVQSGKFTVAPTSWNVPVTPGDSISKTFTVSNNGGLVRDVKISIIDVPSWVTIDSTYLGDISSGSSKKFTLNVNPSWSAKSGEYPYKFIVKSATGTPSEIYVTGIISIQSGTYSVNPTSWDPVVNAESSVSKEFTVYANGGPIKGVNVIRTNIPSWVSISPTNLGDMTEGTSEKFIMTVNPENWVKSGEYTYDFKVNSVTGDPFEIYITGTIKVCPTTGDDPYEDNDDFEEETVVTEGIYSSLKCFDEDYYKIYLNQGETITVTISFKNSENDLDLYLIDLPPGYLDLDRSDDINTNTETVKYTVDTSGYYIILVMGHRHQYTGSIYSMTINVEEKYGTISVNPNSWNPTIKQGESESKTFTVNTKDGPINNVNIIKQNTLDWVTINPIKLYDLNSGSSKTFVVKISPPESCSGNYPLNLKITYGSQQYIEIKGTITVENKYTSPPPQDPPPAVTLLTVTPTSTTISATWQQYIGQNFQKYLVQYTTDKTWTQTYNGIPIFTKTTTTTIIKNLQPQTTYYIRISTIVNTGYNPLYAYSNVKSTTTTSSSPNKPKEFNEDFETGYNGWYHNQGQMSFIGTQSEIQHEGNNAFKMTGKRGSTGGYAGQYIYDVNIPVTHDTVFKFAYYFPSKDISYIGYRINFDNGKRGVYFSLFSGSFVNTQTVYVHQYKNENIKTWHQHQENIYNNYKAAYGNVPSNLQITSISMMMGDPYKTGRTQTAYYDSITITKETTVNNPPNIPSTPKGESILIEGETGTYSTRTTDIDTDNVKYGWDWNGDGNVDEWTEFQASGQTITTTHTWNTPNTYNIQVKAEDTKGTQSSWSQILTVKINQKNEEDNSFYEDFETDYDGWYHNQGQMSFVGTQSQIKLEGNNAFKMTGKRGSTGGYAGQYIYDKNIPVTSDLKFKFAYYFPSKDISYVGYRLNFNTGKSCIYFSLFYGSYINTDKVYLHQYKNEDTNTWHVHSENIYNDYKNGFGTVPSDLCITGISVMMGDPYFSGITQTAYYDSISIYK